MDQIRPYTPDDRRGCLELFDSNTPTYFLPEERDPYRLFLDRQPALYWVLDEADRLVACGGVAMRDQEASLCWGMIRRDRHRSGLGTKLLLYRLAKAAQELSARSVRLDTSQHSVGFFRKHGFLTTAIAKDHYGPGLDRYDLRLILSEPVKAALRPLSGGPATLEMIGEVAQALRKLAAAGV